MAKQTFTEAESWNIIQEMIANAKQEIRNDSFYFLLWGWLVLIASLAHFALLYTSYEHPYSVWLLMIVGAAGTVYRSRKAHKKYRVRTYVDTFIINLWIAISAGIVISLLSAGFVTGWQAAYPYIILLYGIGTYLSGVIFKFKPLKIGGIISWCIALAAFFVSFPVQLLLLALTTLVAYLIPGYLIKK
ncbi:hypothetical protein OKW21_005767 [Catalinimonas alkaloidigena]|uniref:hypothetical protein n=1 Tax=Catalinimonas alkaloidigena TaxID=1075417 RepID=UPI002406E323|nr:hypothetical protein [Catalinimonas alkaloidigena]MDF9800504.1 hypothetical protein [Catalinimonas alkaloidigena]